MLISIINPFQALKYGLTGVFLLLDGIVYWAISKLFALYEALAGAEIITQKAYQDIADKFYVIIGVVMLFYLAYALLKSLINPDELGKNTTKLLTNSVISLVLLGIVPTIFSYAFDLQKIIIEDHVIDNLIFGKSDNSLGKQGNKAAMNVLNAFLNDEDVNIQGESGVYWYDFKSDIVGTNPTYSFTNITDFGEPIQEGDASYLPIISTLCGLFLGYVLISFCLDLGIRVIKLAFYQIIAPIPILLRIMPEKKSTFDNWVKGSIAAYMEVFVRMFIMYIIVYLSAEIFDRDKVLFPSSGLGFIGNVIVILGLFAFAKQAPKLISDVIGVDSGNIKLGIGGKLAAGGAFGFGAILGGAASLGIKNLTKGYSDTVNKWGEFKGTKGKGFSTRANALGSVFSTAWKDTRTRPVHHLASVGAGVIGGGFHSAWKGFKAKNAKEMAQAVSEGVQTGINKRDERETYKSNHGGTLGGVVGGHIADFSRKLGQYSGLTAGLEALKKEQTKANDVKNSRKAVDDKLTALLTKYKDSMTTAGPAVDAGFTDSSGRAVEFSNYATLLNEMEIMKSTGKMSDGVTTATADMLTKMSAAEFKLKEQMKLEILQGFDLRNKTGAGSNHKFTETEFKELYDGELQSLVTDYRTKALQNASIINANADKSIASVATALGNFTKQAIENQNQELYEFVSTNNVTELFEKSKDAISNATGRIDNAVNKKFQEEAKKDSK